MRKKRKENVIRKDTSTKAIKTTRKKAAAKPKAPKVRNNGTMTESEFWSFIRAGLRKQTRFWKPRLKVLNDAKRPYVGINKRQKFEYQCSHCKEWFMQKNVEVNHKDSCGSLRSADDLKDFVDRMFCESNGLEVVCKPCHIAFHKKEREDKLLQDDI